MINAFRLECNSSLSCNGLSFSIDSKTIQNMQLLCIGYRSCDEMDIKAPISIINDLDIQCIDIYSCYQLNIIGQISGDGNVECKGLGSCRRTKIILYSVSQSTKFNIQCKSCNFADIYFYGFKGIFIFGACQKIIQNKKKQKRFI